jgi:hypothetical protein
MLLSEYLDLGSQLDEQGVFDPDLEEDSHFFINLQRLKQTRVPEFRDSYEKIHEYFRKIIKLLANAQKKDNSDIFYKRAIGLFKFSEVNGICLGYARGVSGAGFGKKLRENVISTAYDIVKSGIRDPEFFELLPLFQENVGADRLSDMIATLILEDIRSYTWRINCTLHIDPNRYKRKTFHEGFLVNPYKHDDLLLVPVNILHKLPIVRSWEDIDNVITLNESVRAEMNDEVARVWKKHTSNEKKEYLKRVIFENPLVFSRVIKGYRLETLEECKGYEDFDYFLKKLEPAFAKYYVDHYITCGDDSLSAAHSILESFRDWVEYQRGWEIIQNSDGRSREKSVQTIMLLAANVYNRDHIWDISREPDAGRGPVDFKISRGSDKTIIEVKLSSNPQYIHGYTSQIEEYAKAEQTDKRIYVFIDLGNPQKLKHLKDYRDHKFNIGENPPDLVIIDARKRESASRA